jgi:hypothetical protein
MRESPALNHVVLGCGDEVTKALCANLLRAIIESNRIEHLRLEIFAPVSSDDFSRFMRTTRSLMILRMSDLAVHGISIHAPSKRTKVWSYSSWWTMKDRV